MRMRQRAIHATRRKFVFGELTVPDERFMTQLRRRCKPEVQALSEYLGRDLVSYWGYDQLED